MKSINEKVDWKVFILTVGTIVTVFGFIWDAINRTNDRLDLQNKDITQIKSDVSFIRGKIEGNTTVSGEGTNLLNLMYKHD